MGFLKSAGEGVQLGEGVYPIFTIVFSSSLRICKKFDRTNPTYPFTLDLDFSTLNTQNHLMILLLQRPP